MIAVMLVSQCEKKIMVSVILNIWVTNLKDNKDSGAFKGSFTSVQREKASKIKENLPLLLFY